MSEESDQQLAHRISNLAATRAEQPPFEKYAPVAMGEIIEVEQTNSPGRANQLLAAGFQLISVVGTSYEHERRWNPQGGDGPATFVRHNVEYVIGRANGWPAFPERPAREPRPEAKP